MISAISASRYLPSATLSKPMVNGEEESIILVDDSELVRITAPFVDITLLEEDDRAPSNPKLNK